MESNFGGLMNYVTVRFDPAATLTSEERVKLIQHLIYDALTRDTLRADQCAHLSAYLAEVVVHLAQHALAKRNNGQCKYCGGDHEQINCVYLRRSKQRGEMIL